MKKAILLSIVGLILIGCYGTDQEIILANEAVQIYNLPGTYQNGVKSPGGNVKVEAVSGTNDYRFRETFKDGGVDSGYIRFIPLTGNIYIGQMKFDDDPWYYLQFFRIESGSYKELFLTENAYDNIKALASSYNVELDPDIDLDALKGTRSDILAFLKAHANLSFE